MASVNAPSKRNDRIRLGISSCLLGEEVRFDKGHKRDGYIAGTLGRYFEFVPVCPEVAIGMGVPREPIRLLGDADEPRAVGVRTGSPDVTDALVAYGRRMARELGDISGYIFKSKSPSCGMERVKLFSDKGAASSRGIGLYAREIMRARPLLPVAEEGRLNDPRLRANFIEQVFAYRRWQDLAASRLTLAKLAAFHTAHELSLMAHGPEGLRRLGRLLAEAGARPVDELAREYIAGFMQIMQRGATRKRHASVMMHLMGYLKRKVDREDRAELLEVIEAYRLGYLPLAVPITLLNHHFRRHPDAYAAQQVYLNPHPGELMLRNEL